jgi:hypothetical protein
MFRRRFGDLTQTGIVFAQKQDISFDIAALHGSPFN